MKILRITIAACLALSLGCSGPDTQRDATNEHDGFEISGFSQGEQHCCDPVSSNMFGGCQDPRRRGGGVCITLRITTKVQPRHLVAGLLFIGDDTSGKHALTEIVNADDRGNAVLQFDPLCVPCSEIVYDPNTPGTGPVAPITILLGRGVSSAVRTFDVPITQAVYEDCCKDS